MRGVTSGTFEGWAVEQEQFEYGDDELNTLKQQLVEGKEQLVKTVEYVTPRGLDRYRETAAVRKSLLTEPYPASTGVLCHALLRPEFDIEIDPTAMFFDDA